MLKGNNRVHQKPAGGIGIQHQRDGAQIKHRREPAVLKNTQQFRAAGCGRRFDQHAMGPHPATPTESW